MEMASSPRSVEEIFKDFNARRTAVLRALTLGTFSFVSLNLGFLFFLQAFNVKVLTFFVFVFVPFFADVDEFYGLCDPGKKVYTGSEFIIYSIFVLILF